MLSGPSTALASGGLPYADAARCSRALPATFALLASLRLNTKLLSKHGSQLKASDPLSAKITCFCTLTFCPLPSLQLHRLLEGHADIMSEHRISSFADTRVPWYVAMILPTAPCHVFVTWPSARCPNRDLAPVLLAGAMIQGRPPSRIRKVIRHPNGILAISTLEEGTPPSFAT